MPRLHILIADDHLLFTQALIGQLSPQLPECDWHSVGSLSELSAADTCDISLAIVDLSLGDGEAFQWLEANKTVRTLIVTSAREEAVITRVLALEVNGIAHKSDDLDCLLLAIRTVLGGGRYLSPRIQSLHHAIKRRPDALHKILSPREYEVLRLVGAGLSTDEIASQLGLRASSVSDHKKNLMMKLDVHSAAELMRSSFERGVARI
jgi:DNA-binding NarL/FixJ family response regulator